jgi:hypothetical protein
MNAAPAPDKFARAICKSGGRGSSHRNDPLKRTGEPQPGEVGAEMQRYSQRDDQTSEPLLRRLDRVAGEVNPFLIILMVGLRLLNLTRVVTLGLKNLPITRVDPSCLISQTSTTSGIGVVYPPS